MIKCVFLFWKQGPLVFVDVHHFHTCSSFLPMNAYWAVVLHLGLVGHCMFLCGTKYGGKYAAALLLINVAYGDQSESARAMMTQR